MTNWYLSDLSIQRGFMPLWTMGTIIKYYRDENIGHDMFVLNIGRLDTKRHFEEKFVRLTKGPSMLEIGSGKKHSLALHSSNNIGYIGDYVEDLGGGR